MSVNNDIRKFILEINESKNNAQTLSSLTKLEKQTASLRIENEQLEKVMAHLKAKGEGTGKAFTEMKAKLNDNKKAVRDNNEQMKGLRKTLDYTYQSSGMLRKRARELSSTLGAMSQKANPGEYARLTAELNKVRAAMNSTGAGGKKMQSIFSKMATGIGSVIGTISFAGIAYGLKRFISSADEDFNRFEERVDNLSALTKLEGEQLAWLADEAKKASVSTIEGNIRIKQSADDIVDAYTSVGSKRPELLKSKEALAAVTQDAIILSEAAKGPLSESVEGVTMALNQFELSADQSRRAINILAAGSQAGAGDIPYLTEALEKSGTTANLMGVQMEQWAGSIEAVAPYYTEASVAGNSFDKVLLKMKSKQIGYTNGVFNLNDALDSLDKQFKSGQSATSIFGVEHAKMAELLVKNRDQVISYTKAVTGSEVAMTQAATNTDNNAAKRAQALNKLKLVYLELGEVISPLLTSGISLGGQLTKVVMALINTFMKFKGVIIAGVAGYVTYNALVKLSNINLATNITLTKAKVMWEKIQKGALLLSAAAQALFTGNLVRANIAMKAFNTTTKLNPFVALAAVIVAAGVALYMFSNRATTATKVQKTLTDMNLRAANSIADEKTQLDILLKIAKDDTKSKKDRKKAMDEINKISPEYLGSITLETINTEESTTAIDNYTKSLEKKAKMQAAQEMLVELEKKHMKELNDGSSTRVKWYEKIGNAVLAGGNAQAMAFHNTRTGLKNLSESEDEYLAKKEALMEFLSDPAYINALSGNGGGGGSTTKTYDDQLKDLARFRKEKALALKQDYAQGIIDKDAYNQSLLLLDAGYYKDLASLQEKNGKDSLDAKSSLLDSQIKLVETNNKLFEEIVADGMEAELLKIEAESDAVEAIIDKTTQKAKRAIAEARSLLEETVRLKKEIEQLQANARGEETKETENKTMENKIAKAKEYLDISEAINEQQKTLPEKEEKELLTLQKIYDDKLISTEVFEQNKTAITEKYEAERQAIEDDNWKHRLEKMQEYLSISSSLADSLATFTEAAENRKLNAVQTQVESGVLSEEEGTAQKEKIQKEYAEKQKKIAIAQAIISGGLAIMKIAAEVPKADFGIMTGILIAAQAVMTAAQVAKISSQEFAEGGHTGPGHKYEVAGTVHKGEYVIPQEGVNNPNLRPVIDYMEIARRNGTLSNLMNPFMFAPVSQSRGFADGGYTSSTNNINGSSAPDNSKMMELMMMQANAITRLSNQLDSGINAKVNYYGSNGIKDASDRDAEMQSNLLGN